MYGNDDEELAKLPLTDSRRFERADQGRKEAREMKAKEKGKLLQLKREMLRSQVSPDKGAADAGKKDEEQKQKEKADEKADRSKAFHTETLKEKEEKAIDTGQTQEGPETLIGKEAQHAEDVKQAGQEYQQEARVRPAAFCARSIITAAPLRRCDGLR